MSSFFNIYKLTREKMKQEINSVHLEASRELSTKCKVYAEFRFIILTVVIVVAALTMQKTVEDIIDTTIRQKLGSNTTRILGMLAVSFLLVFLAILIVVFWKPPLEVRLNVGASADVTPHDFGQKTNG